MGRNPLASSQSTGYCPDVESWPAVAAACERAGLSHPAGFTTGFTFRHCPDCQQLNLVKDDDFTCTICQAELPLRRNATTVVAVMLLVNRAGDILLQRRNSESPRFPDRWGVPGGHCEPGETPEQTAVRELWEETGLRPDAPATLFERHEDAWTPGFVEHYFSAGTIAGQEDVIRNDDGIIVFVPAGEVLAERSFTPDTADTAIAPLRSSGPIWEPLGPTGLIAISVTRYVLAPGCVRRGDSRGSRLEATAGQAKLNTPPMHRSTDPHQ